MNDYYLSRFIVISISQITTLEHGYDGTYYKLYVDTVYNLISNDILVLICI